MSLLVQSSLEVFQSDTSIAELLLQRYILVHEGQHALLSVPIKLNFELFKFTQSTLVLALSLL